jgi:hypothetical protein
MTDLPPRQAPPERDLYKVRVEVEVCVMAQNSKEAIKTAKENAGSEIESYGSAKATMIARESDVPKSWIDTIPYTPYGAVDEDKTCKMLMAEIVSRRKEKAERKNDDILEDEDMKEVLRLHGQKADKVIEGKQDKKVRPETRPDPKPPKDLEWEQTEDEPPLPPLRFL